LPINKKFKMLILAAIILLVASQGLQILLNSSNVFQDPNYRLNGTVGSKTYWMSLATDAWQYFQVGTSVNLVTGLHVAGLEYPYFTDWDLGVYTQAIIDAEKLGIIGSGGAYGADWRFDKILTFLESRPLMSDGQPYAWYRTDGKNRDNMPQVATDTANLLVSLNNLKIYRQDLASRINYIVYNRTNYKSQCETVDALAGSINVYDYYVASGFATFWPNRFSSETNTILNNIVNASTVQTYGVTVPKAKLTSEPLLLSVFNFEKPDMRLLNLSRQVYLAEEARYKATGKYTAFSEGNIVGGNDVYYAWEWVVLPDGRTWVMTKDETSVISLTPIVFLKVAVGLEAIYRSNFTQSMVSALEPAAYSQNGFKDGVSENGQVEPSIVDKTNGMILAAATYAINNNHVTS